jgi:riboflavin synthase
MFTGLVQQLGEILSIIKMEDTHMRVCILPDLEMKAFQLGASVSCDGICLTLVASGPKGFEVELSSETLRTTTASSWHIGQKINLEPALCMGDSLGGHWVLGHVDGLAQLVDQTKIGQSFSMTFQLDPKWYRYLPPKGSISLNGVSLTLNASDPKGYVTVMIIPHTYEHTNFSQLILGQAVNMEIDALARYALHGLTMKETE